jgi:hypothetical protein
MGHWLHLGRKGDKISGVRVLQAETSHAKVLRQMCALVDKEIAEANVAGVE